MTPYGMNFQDPSMMDRYRQAAMQAQMSPPDPTRATTMPVPNPPSSYKTVIGGGDVWNRLGGMVKPTSPYEAPEEHPGAGGVTRSPLDDIMARSSEGPGGFDGKAQQRAEWMRQHPGQLPFEFKPVPGATNPGGNTMPPTAGPKLDQSAWDTDGYAKPGYTAANPGNVLPGWDAAKWADANHQTPKYVVGRILGEAGNLKDPNARNAAIQKILQAYPGATFDGKDALTIPGVGTADIFRGADAGEFAPQWLTDGGAGGGAGMPLPPTATPVGPIYTAGSTPGLNSDFFQKLMARLKNDPGMVQPAATDPNVAHMLMAQQLGGAQ